MCKLANLRRQLIGRFVVMSVVRKSVYIINLKHRIGRALDLYRLHIVI